MTTSLFTKPTTEILLNPRMDQNFQTHIITLLNTLNIKNHVFIATSGTTRGFNDAFKLVALSKNAILTSAKAVNTHLDATSEDIWLNPLPLFHVGGLGILARSHLSNSSVVPMNKWCPHEFTNLIEKHQITLTSLVPAQVYDLIFHQLRAPKSLRCVIVGGGALNDSLYEKALLLGWPLMVSYGLTENASQVATSKLNSKKLISLNHVQAKIDDLGFLKIKSESLLTANIFVKGDSIEVIDPKVDGWYTTEDLGEFEGESLNILGRAHDFIKIGGESVLFSNLEKKFEEVKLGCKLKEDAALIAYPDDRLGFVVHLVSTTCAIDLVVDAYNLSVMPYERIRKTHVVEAIPRTFLNKLCKNDLLALLN